MAATDRVRVSAPTEQRNPASAEIDTLRMEGRLARSNTEAALDRFNAEPRSDPAVGALLAQIMANSHRMVYAMMAMETNFSGTTPEFMVFAHRTEVILHSLAAALGGAHLRADSLPDLRAAQLDMAAAGHPLAVEADRLTNSLNTLAEKVVELTSLPAFSNGKRAL